MPFRPHSASSSIPKTNKKATVRQKEKGTPTLPPVAGSGRRGADVASPAAFQRSAAVARTRMTGPLPRAANPLGARWWGSRTGVPRGRWRRAEGAAARSSRRRCGLPAPQQSSTRPVRRPSIRTSVLCARGSSEQTPTSRRSRLQLADARSGNYRPHFFRGGTHGASERLTSSSL